MNYRAFTAFVLFVLSSVANAAWYNCTPSDVTAFSNRVHVRCSNPTGNIQYFAMSTSSSTQADRFVSIATTALVAGHTVIVLYDPNDLSGESWGCQTNDCRRATAIGLK